MAGDLPLALLDTKPGERLYLQMSGGLDSSYLAWRLLGLGYRLLVWHCSFRTAQGRWPHEDAAYTNVIAWLRQQPGFAERLDELPQGLYSAGGAIDGWRLDYTFLWPEAGWHLRAIDHMGKHLPVRQDIRYIVVSDHQESRNIDDEPHTLAYETLNRNAGWPRFRERIGRLRPMSQYNRVQIIGDMPEELIRLCWWCRTPRDGQPCHRCATCRVVDPALDANGIVLN